MLSQGAESRAHPKHSPRPNTNKLVWDGPQTLDKHGGKILHRVCAFEAGYRIRRVAALRHARRIETKRMREEREFLAFHGRQRNLREPVL